MSIVINPETRSSIIIKLESWYREHARGLPWRLTSDPYAIWVSEIMLQQTRVETVIPYYKRWLAELPTLIDLAEADQDRVLKLWEGLGYYSRALNLHKAAQIVLNTYGGRLPGDVKTLRTLPGIGVYTAGAIASIAYGLPSPILDGNIRRVFTRVFKITSPLEESSTENDLWQIAEELLPDEHPGNFNQALMELGALVCTPKNPHCDHCPIIEDCLSIRFQLQNVLPVRMKKPPLPHYQVTAAIFEEDGKFLLAKRPSDGLLGGMWEFPGGKQETHETLPEALTREIKEELNAAIKVGEHLGTYKHAYTHYKITLHAFRCTLISDDLELNYHTDLTWTSIDSLTSYPMGKLDRLIANRLYQDSIMDKVD